MVRYAGAGRRAMFLVEELLEEGRETNKCVKRLQTHCCTLVRVRQIVAENTRAWKRPGPQSSRPAGDTRLQGDSIATENSLLGNGYPQMFCISAPFQAFRGSSGCYQGTTSISRNSITVTSVPMFPHDANECLPPGL